MKTQSIGPMMYAAAVGLAIAMVWVASVSPALPHDALPTAAKPQGWQYPFSCCSNNDCREVKMGTTVKEKGNGYVIAKTGEVLAHGDSRIKESPDGSTHLCTVAGLDDSRTICLYVPPPAY